MTTATQPSKRSATEVLHTYIPILAWLPAYQKSWLRADVIAALTIWALLVPEAMAYAGIAGMPPETGLYAAPLAMLAYAIFGSSRHLTVGPSSAIAALSFSVVAALAIPGSSEFILLTILLALIVGVMLIVASILRLGLLADFLSRPVLDGFVLGVAVSIAVGQLDKLVGFEPTSAYEFVPDILLFIRDIDMIHVPTLVVGVTSLALLFLLHRYVPKIPAPLVVLFLSITLSGLLGFEAMGIEVAGEIPAGAPPFGLPEGMTLAQVMALLPGAVGVALVAFAESVAIARAFGVKFGYDVNADQELLAVGVSNIGSGFSGGFVVNGSMSRTSASVTAGGQSQMVALIGAAAIFITALAFTPLFYNLPEATLGAIVIHAVWHSIRLSKVTQYRAITRLDFATAVIAAVGVLFLGLLEGLLLAAGLGLVVLLFNTKRRNTHVLGQVPGTTVFRSLEYYPDGQTFPGLLILRFDGTLFFANSPDFVVALRKSVAATQPPPRVILLDCESMNDIDATAVITLVELEKELTRSGTDLRLARVKTDVQNVMHRADLEKAIPAEHWYLTVREGVEAFLQEMGD
ncbi:MAG: SulP family inorganic anion transporter [Anaerolineae bacterium]|nr:SulP family inorganic anion transporter [Anaerolineae bacterium]